MLYNKFVISLTIAYILMCCYVFFSANSNKKLELHYVPQHAARPENSSLKPSRTLLWIHLAKTGGTSLIESLRAKLPGRFDHYWENPSRAEVNKFRASGRIPRVIGGHLPYGFHKWLTHSDYVYGTILRHPVSRTWSHYQYQLNRKDDPNHAWAANRTLSEWLRSVEFGNNAMTAYLSGAEPYAWWNEDELCLLPARIDGKPNPGYNVTRYHYSLARRNLCSFGFVGLQEAYEESIAKLSKFLAVKLSVSRKNKSVKKTEPSPSQAKIIESYNRWDLRLYRLAERLFREEDACGSPEWDL
jgi:hypothetical protein